MGLRSNVALLSRYLKPKAVHTVSIIALVFVLLTILNRAHSFTSITTALNQWQEPESVVSDKDSPNIDVGVLTKPPEPTGRAPYIAQTSALRDNSPHESTAIQSNPSDQHVAHSVYEHTTRTKAVVLGHTAEEDIDWVTQELTDWRPFIYAVEPSSTPAPGELGTPANKGKEATVYLTYIIDHYDQLPDVVVFLHAHRSGYPEAWHNEFQDYDAVEMLRKLQVDYVVKQGYANLRCNHIPGCPADLKPWVPRDDDGYAFASIYPLVYMDFFNRTMEQARREVETVGVACCAQFAVSREQIRKHSCAEYARWRQYILDSESSDKDIGTVMEYMWHIIFGREAVHCDDMIRCYCKVYGRC